MQPEYPTRREDEKRLSLLLTNQQMMTNIAKQAVGIDVAQEELVVSLGRISHNTGIEIYAYKTFANSISGF